MPDPTTHTDPTTPAGTATHAEDGVLTRLHEEEDGAQAMEYAALAGGGVTLVTLIVQLMRSERVMDAMSGLLASLIDQLGTALGGLF